MTAPSQPPPAQPPQLNTQALAVAAAITTATSAAGAAAILAPMFAGEKITRGMLEGALGVVMGMPPEQSGFYGPATRYVTSLNLMRRAQFAVASARRLRDAVISGRSHGIGAARALATQLAAERRYFGQHRTAIWAREQAAARIDSASMAYGLLLGWNTVLTPSTTAECKAADRHNFWADRMPVIGWPGMAHPGCRCFPGPHVPGAPMVGSRPRVPAKAAAYA